MIRYFLENEDPEFSAGAEDERVFVQHLLSRPDGNKFPPASFILETDDSFNPGKERVVLAAADIESGFDGRAPLTDEDRPGQNLLAAEPLDAQPLAAAVPPVSRASA
jgi:hypothetical protein